MAQTYLLVYSGEFETEEEATAFAEAQYPEAEERESEDFEEDDFGMDEDEEEGNWTEPSCELWEDIEGQVDPDYLEVVFGEARYDYLESVLVDSDDVAAVEEAADSGDNTLFLVILEGENADESFSEHPDRLVFCGRYACTID